MKKYLIVGVATFSLLITTVYAFNDNRNHNRFFYESTMYNQNCPYHSGNEECPYHSDSEHCPYYDETTDTHNCSNSKNVNCQHKNIDNGNSYGRYDGHSRHGGHSHHNR